MSCESFLFRHFSIGMVVVVMVMEMEGIQHEERARTSLSRCRVEFFVRITSLSLRLLPCLEVLGTGASEEVGSDRRERQRKAKRTTCLEPIFCGVGLDRTPLLTRVCVLPRQKDTLRTVHKGWREEEGSRKRKMVRKREKDTCRTTRVAPCRRGGGWFVGKTDVGLG